jgi:IS5 family transposase
MARPVSSQLSFADAELKAQGIGLDKTLKAISDLLDRAPSLVDRVWQDLRRGLKRPATGRAAMSAVQVLRSFILRRIKNWDLRELRERIADGYSLRIFTAFDCQPVPSHQAFSRAFNRLTPETVRALNDAVVEAAVELRLEDARQLRIDTTVVETDIHFPTDSTLLWDVVRVITRLVKYLRRELPSLGAAFPDRTRRARRRAQQISRMSSGQRTRQQRRRYRDLLQVCEEVLDKAQPVAEEAKSILPSLGPVEAGVVEDLLSQIQHFSGLGRRVVAQTTRRIIEDEPVPVEEKLFSIFEPHTDLIVRGKARTPVEFGHKVLLVESAHGLITHYQVLAGNPSDQDHVTPVLLRHQQTFGLPPELLAADRGFYSEDNLAACTTAGVEIESIPQRGGQKTPQREAHENSRAFKRAQRFRSGIEGRISVLFRGRGMKRCLSEGPERFETFVGAAVLANNLLVLVALLEKRRPRRRAA